MGIRPHDAGRRPILYGLQILLLRLVTESVRRTITYSRVTASDPRVKLLSPLSTLLHLDYKSHAHLSSYRSSLAKSFALHASEHYPTSTTAAVPTSDGTSIILLLAAHKYSPSNFWNGRFRCIYTYSPSTNTLIGTIKCDVHYYEDGNVRLTTTKVVPETNLPSGAKAGDVIREVAKAEKRYQEELNRGFSELNDSSFKGLRRQLPITRQKVEWEKVGSYRAGREIGGATAGVGRP